MSARPAQKILIIDDDPDFLRLCQYMLEESGHRVATAKDHDQAIGRIRESEPAVILLDRQLEEADGLDLIAPLQALAPTATIILITAQSSYELAVKAIKLGATDFLEKPLDQARLFTVINSALERSQLLETIGPEPDDDQGFEGIIGQSPPMRALYAMIENVAATDASVMIRGESGTGKELIATAVHSRSAVSDGPFVPINMATLPAELVESTLFGHEKGAFTGADARRIGACEESQNGTLFLDEITEMPIELQPKLLRFLQEKTFRRVGGSKDIASNARIVCATNRDPQLAIQDNKLREDLYYRLNVIPIDLPPLRDRPGDISLLTTFAVHRLAAKYGKSFTGTSQECLQHLVSYPWPGNVRQLLHVIERAIILHDGQTLEPTMLELEAQHPPATDAPSTPAQANDPLQADRPQQLDGQTVAPFSGDQIYPMSELERMAIIHALKVCNGSPSVASRRLGISPATIYRKIKAYGIETDQS